MDIVIDLSRIQAILNLPGDVLLYRMMITFGWIPVAVVLLWGFKELWLFYARTKWAEKNAKFMLLAIDIPRNNEQSLRAVENMFSYLAGAHGSINLVEKYWEGKWQLYFSFEIVSIEGYTQFLIYTPIGFRDLIESAVYSQSPDAEITEVDDYTQGFPTKFPNEKYDIWGGEFILSDHHMLPIKTYPEFVDTNDPAKVIFKDPMATLMDLNSSLGKGEQLWYQIIIVPIGFGWVKEGDKHTSKVLGEKVAEKKNIGLKIIDAVLGFINEISEAIYKTGGDSKDDKEDDGFKMMNLKPKTKRQIEAIERKTSKVGFETKVRMIYLAEKEVMKKPKVVNGFVGFMKQFGDNALNSLKPDTDVTITTTSYFMKASRLNARKTRAMSAYVGRSDGAGRRARVLNAEELATIWHFPVFTSVKAPLIQTAPGRKAEPPMGLPHPEDLLGYSSSEPVPSFFTEESEEVSKQASRGQETETSNYSSGPPSNLPMI